MKQREIARVAKVLCARFIETALVTGSMFETELLSEEDVVDLEQACWRISDDLYNRGTALGHNGPVVTMGDALRVAGVVVGDKP